MPHNVKDLSHTTAAQSVGANNIDSIVNRFYTVYVSQSFLQELF